MKKSNVIRNIFGGLFIFTGFVEMFSSGLIAGIFMMLFGVSLLPIFYEKTKLNIKYIQIILPIILIFLLGIVTPETTIETNSDINENNMNIVQEEKKNEISELKFNESEMEIDIKENKEIVLEILPNNANTENLELCSSNTQIANIEKSDVEENENKITLKIKPVAEGICEFYVKSTNGIESNKVLLKIIDNERIKIEKEKKEAEENAKKQAEEQAKKEAEEQAKKQAEEQAKKQTQSTSNANSQAKPSQQSTSSSTQSNSNNTHGKKVYRTPSGKRYHFDPDCGGKNSYQTTLDDAKSSGLTPCKKCAQ